MPIYAYRCAACGHARDVLQKISDPLLTVCPVCNADRFEKQVTAAGFQLKGSGWYVTDFRDSGKAAVKPETKTDGAAEAAPASGSAGAEASGADKAVAPTPDKTPAVAPEGGATRAAAPATGAAPTPSSSGA